jgi:hypothetical protein
MLAMSRRLMFVIGAGFAVSGCCPGSGCYIEPPTGALIRLDRLGPIPVRNYVKPAKARKKTTAVTIDDESPGDAELASLKPYSEDWWSVRDAIDRSAEIKLSKRLIICQGCFPSQPDDHTGSIPPK